MESVWIDYVPWAYGTIQAVVTIVVSILGAKYVRNEFLLQKQTLKQQTELTVNINNHTTNPIQKSQQIQREIPPLTNSLQSAFESEEFEVCYSIFLISTIYDTAAVSPIKFLFR